MSECAENPAPVKAKASKSFKVSPDLTRWSIHDQESNQDYAKYQRDEIDEEGESLSSERSDFISRDKISRAISGMVPDFYEVQAEHSPEGDMPLPDGFANTFTFWRILGVAIFLGLTMGTVGECFVNIVDEVCTYLSSIDRQIYCY